MALRRTFTNLNNPDAGTRIMITGICATIKFWSGSGLSTSWRFEGVPLFCFVDWIGQSASDSGIGGTIEFPPIFDGNGKAIPYNQSVSFISLTAGVLIQTFDDPELANDSRQSNAGRRIA